MKENNEIIADYDQTEKSAQDGWGKIEWIFAILVVGGLGALFIPPLSEEYGLWRAILYYVGGFIAFAVAIGAWIFLKETQGRIMAKHSNKKED